MMGRISPKYRKIGLALLFSCALGVSLRSGDNLRYLDESDYDQLARTLLHSHTFAFGDGFPTAWRPPAYPVFIAAAYAISERPVTAKIQNVFVLILSAIALGLVASRIHPNASSLVPFLVLGYPLLTYAASVLYPQIFGCLLLTTTVMFLSGERPSGRYAAAAGLIYGMLILAIPSFALMMPVFAAYLFFLPDMPWGLRIRRTLLLAGSAALVVAPWTVRNYVDFHTLIPVSANGGWNLFIGNSPETTPNGSVAGVNVISLCKRVRPDMDVIELDRAVGKCAKDWITEHPWSAIKLYAGKITNYFNFRNELATKDAESHWTDWLVFATYYPLLLIVLLRAALFRRIPFSKAETLIYIVYFSNALISAIYFTRIRFRIPFDFLLIAVASSFLCKCWDTLRKRESNKMLTERSS
jgi:hypothetical protein